MWQEEKSCDEVETVREITYLGDRVNADGGCEAAVIATARCGLDWLGLGTMVSCYVQGGIVLRKNRLFTVALLSQQFCMGVKYSTREKIRWKFCEGLGDLWLNKCTEYSLMIG